MILTSRSRHSVFRDTMGSNMVQHLFPYNSPRAFDVLATCCYFHSFNWFAIDFFGAICHNHMVLKALNNRMNLLAFCRLA